MRETCFCGWSGDLEDRAPAYLGDGAWGLACPGCDRPDDLAWLPAATAQLALAEARERRLARPTTPTSIGAGDAPRARRVHGHGW